MEEIINQIDENNKVIQECDETLNRILEVEKLIELMEEKK